MNTRQRSGSLAVVRLARTMLLELACREDQLAATQAAQLPYWQPCPASVSGHRAAAVALREHAERLDVACGESS